MAEVLQNELEEVSHVSQNKDKKNDEDDTDGDNKILHKEPDCEGPGKIGTSDEAMRQTDFREMTAGEEESASGSGNKTKESDEIILEYGESSMRKEVHFPHEHMAESDTSSQDTRVPLNDVKILKNGPKVSGAIERGAGPSDTGSETLSSNWAFSTRASIIPSKFDHMATLKMTFSAFKESRGEKEGIPLSLLPEVLESARFMVPPPHDLVPLLQRIEPEYKSGGIVRWNLLQQLALQIERKEARYPFVFNPRCSVVRPSSTSPSNWKALQRSPSRRTHPEDDCPEVEPQLFEDNKRRASMLERHAQEKEQAEKAYREELQERNQLWEERLKNFHKEVVEHAQRLKQQQLAIFQNFKDKMASKAPCKPQWSGELLKQRRIQIYLGKQGKYLEAQEVKQIADRMEQAELQVTIAAFQTEVSAKEQALRVKQQTEMDILLQRAARTREEIRKSRTFDLQRCHQRHKNVMRELAAIQKQEVFRFDQLMQKKVVNYRSSVGHNHRQSLSPTSRHPTNASDFGAEDATISSLCDVDSLGDT